MPVRPQPEELEGRCANWVMTSAGSMRSANWRVEPDEELLRLAAKGERVLVSQNVADFPNLLREWAEAGRSDAGVILVYGIDHREFGLIVRGIDRRSALLPKPSDWTGLSAIVDRKLASAPFGAV